MASMLKSKASVGVNTLVRLVSGVAVFVLLARYLGPASFSLLATAMAAGSMAALLTDYGLPNHTLRAAAMEPGRLRTIVRGALILKIALVGLCLMSGTIILFFLPLSASARVAVAVCFTAVLLASVADLCFIAPRAVEQFGRETTPVIWTSGLSLILVGGTAALTRDLVLTSFAFGVSRIVYLGAALAVLRSLTQAQHLEALPGGLSRLLKSSGGFALDGLLTNLSGQIDILLVPLFLSATEAGIYQAGARIVQVIAPLAMILGTVYIPRLASLKHSQDTKAFLKLADRAGLEFFGLGVLVFGVFCFVLPPTTSLIFGPDYIALHNIWPYFAISALCRVVAAGAGVRLAAEGRSFGRVISHSAALAFILPMFLIFAKDGSAAGIGALMACGTAVLLVAMSVSVFVSNTTLGFRLSDYKYAVSAIIIGSVTMIIC